VKIHTRTLVIITFTVLILIVAMLFLAQFFILQSYAQIEQKESFVNVERVTSQIDFEKEKLGESTRDWAVWDDTYTFVEDQNPAYISSNLNYGVSFENIQVNGVLYYNNSADYVYGRWYDLEKKTESNVPQGVRDYFSGHPGLLKNLSSEGGMQGFILPPEGLYQVSMHPILKSNGEGPRRGTIILLRSYDGPRVNALQDRAHIPVKMVLLDDQWLSTDPVVLQLTTPGAPDIISRVHNSSTLLSTTLINDIEDKPIVLMKVTTTRSVYQQAIDTVSFFLVAFLIIAVIFGAVTELLMRRYIVNPLADLDAAMTVIGQKRDL